MVDVFNIQSVWSTANQDSSHVGAAGVCTVSLLGTPVTVPTFATAQFHRFYDLGRAVRLILPIDGGRVMHLMSCLMLLFVSLRLLVKVNLPFLLETYFNLELTKIPSLLKGISAGHCVGLLLMVNNLALIARVIGTSLEHRSSEETWSDHFQPRLRYHHLQERNGARRLLVAASSSQPKLNRKTCCVRHSVNPSKKRRIGVKEFWAESRWSE